MSSILEVKSVFKSYGALPVLSDLSLDVMPGEIYAIIGPNGAGKTTLFKVMTGEVPCNSGSVLFKGADITSHSAHSRVRLGIGRTFQVARVFREFTVRQNLELAIEARRRNSGESLGPRFALRPSPAVADETEQVMREFGFVHLAGVRADMLSHGDKKRLEFAVVLALKPSILMLDEPTAGMSPTDRAAVAKMIRDFREKYNITVVMTEHDMDIVFGLADRIMVLSYGETVAVGSADEVRNDQAVRQVYLGQEMYDA